MTSPKRDSTDVLRWAYRTVTPQSFPHLARVEVGSELDDELRKLATVHDPRPSPTYATLLGVPLAVSDTLPPMGWRTLDAFGDVLASGSGL